MNEPRLLALRWRQDALSRLPKDVGHERRTPSYLGLWELPYLGHEEEEEEEEEERTGKKGEKGRSVIGGWFCGKLTRFFNFHISHFFNSFF